MKCRKAVWHGTRTSRAVIDGDQKTALDKLSAVLTFVDDVLLHVSRGVRWDSDHGLIALGCRVPRVENITATMIKTARVLLGTLAAGGPRFMSQEQVDRIHTRPDGLYRRRQLGLV